MKLHYGVTSATLGKYFLNRSWSRVAIFQPMISACAPMKKSGSGILGGPHLVRIHGRDGIPRGELLNGLPLFRRDYETKVDLPKADAKQDFEVPADWRG